MAGIEDPNVIDLVTTDSSARIVRVIMVATEPWDGSDARDDELMAKLNTYAAYVIDEGLLRDFPQSHGLKCVIQLDTIHELDRTAMAVVHRARLALSNFGVEFVVNVLRD